MLEKQILQAALFNFEKLSKLKIREVKSPHKYISATNKVDAFIEISSSNNNYAFVAEIKNEVKDMQLGSIVQQLSRDSQKQLLICKYISEISRGKLHQEGINYLDASGNCCIRNGDLHVFITGQKVAPQRKSNTSKLWKPAGLRLIFSILTNPDLINDPYRSIGKHSKLSLGSIGDLIDELENEKYIRQYKSEWQIENREALLNHWIETYYAILRPKLMQGNFRFAIPKDRDNWRNLKLPQSYWGGEPAGAIYTDFLRPEKFTIYTDLPNIEIIKRLRLAPSPNGEVELLKTFWHTEVQFEQEAQVVPPLLVYAELNASLDSRNRETAERIKKQWLKEKK